jgi:hypothetical protein
VPLRLEGYIDLPEHAGPGGFDHAAVHRGLRRLYVAHTANDALDVIDLDAGRYVCPSHWKGPRVTPGASALFVINSLRYS